MGCDVDRIVGTLSEEGGFRVWFDDRHENYVECPCGWRPDLGTHYQVRTHYAERKSGQARSWADEQVASWIATELGVPERALLRTTRAAERHRRGGNLISTAERRNLCSV
jgi:hypothetical protein